MKLKLELKNVKHHKDMSEETSCFSASLYVDGKLAGEVSNRGTGGAHYFRWKDREVGAAVEAWADEQPLEFKHEKLAQIVDKLLSRHLLRVQLTRWCKKSAVFRLKGDAPDSWRTIKGTFDVKMRLHLLLEYGDKLDRIANGDVEAAVEAAVP